MRETWKRPSSGQARSCDIRDHVSVQVGPSHGPLDNERSGAGVVVADGLGSLGTRSRCEFGNE